MFRLLRLRALGSRLRLDWRLFRHPDVPRATKALLVAIAAYAVLPFDVVPDWVLGLGQLDDVSVVLAGLWLFERFCPRTVVDEERRRLPRG